MDGFFKPSHLLKYDDFETQMRAFNFFARNKIEIFYKNMQQILLRILMRNIFGI